MEDRGIALGKNLYSVNWALGKGDLAGNRFEIVVRNVQQIRVTTTAAGNANDVQHRVHEQHVACNISHVKNRVNCLRANGFMNFYGEQRVGTAGPSSLVGVRASDIGRAMLQRDFENAVDLLLTGRLICHLSLIHI